MLLAAAHPFMSLYSKIKREQMKSDELQWHHDGCDDVWNHWRLDCSLNRLVIQANIQATPSRSKETVPYI